MNLWLLRFVQFCLAGFWLLVCILKLRHEGAGSIPAWSEGALGAVLLIHPSRLTFLASLALAVMFMIYQLWRLWHGQEDSACGCFGAWQVSLRGHTLILIGAALLSWTGWVAAVDNVAPLE